VPGTAPNIDDGFGCTVDSCDEVNDIVVNTPDDSLCDNGDFCDGSETCDALLGCQPGSDPCEAGESCNEETDSCEMPSECGNGEIEAGEQCDDGAANGSTTCGCQLDCTYAPAATPCADGEFCNGDETCDGSGTCQPGSDPCAGGLCDEELDVCVAGGDDDSDGDGIINDNDQCPGTMENEVVNSDGCSIADLCPCSDPIDDDNWKNHGEYVSCVAKISKSFVEQGLITKFEKGLIVSEAARSTCGYKKDYSRGDDKHNHWRPDGSKNHSKDKGRYSDDKRRYSDDKGKYSDDKGKYSGDKGKYSDDKGKNSDDKGKYSDNEGKNRKLKFNNKFLFHVKTDSDQNPFHVMKR